MTKRNYYLKKTCGIYCITHTESGKQYVGQSVDVTERWKHHTTPKKNSTGIKGAIMKWGIEAFTFSVLEECKREDLNAREVWWISTLATLSPSGYNLISGGGQGTSFSKESKQKLSKPKSEEHKQNISESLKGKTSPNKGKTKSKETKQKISDAAKARWARQKLISASSE
jgi:group I intron endonuclease